MKYKMYTLLVSLVSLSLQAGDIVHYARNAHKDFLLEMNNDQMIVIPHYQVDKSIRDLNTEKLSAVLNSGSHYLKATELSDGSYTLDLNGRLPGSGPVAGAIGYVGTKIVIYGCLLAGAYKLTHVNSVQDTDLQEHIHNLPTQVARQAGGEHAMDQLAEPVREVARGVIDTSLSEVGSDIAVGATLSNASLDVPGMAAAGVVARLVSQNEPLSRTAEHTVLVGSLDISRDVAQQTVRRGMGFFERMGHARERANQRMGFLDNLIDRAAVSVGALLTAVPWLP